jgi:hypothetical protein
VHVTDERHPQQEEASEEPTAAEPEWKRRRRLAEVFGEVLPETTADERAPGTAGGPSGDPDRDEPAGDAWLRSQVPPHHG